MTRRGSLTLNRYDIISESVAGDYQKRRIAFIMKNKGGKKDYPFPVDLQNILETASTSTRVKRFIDDLPKHSTTVAGLAMMRKFKVDYRFFVERTLRRPESKPRTKSEWLKLLVQGSPKARYLLHLLERHLIDRQESKILVFTSCPLSAQFLTWVCEALHYNTAFFHSFLTEKEREGLVLDFNDQTSVLEIMITTYKVASQAVDLQKACHTVILAEPAVNTCTEIQAIGRARRTGQLKAQTIHRLFGAGTFNEYQEIKQLQKRKGEMATWGGNDINEALREFYEVQSEEQSQQGSDDASYDAIKRLDRFIKGQARVRTTNVTAGQRFKQYESLEDTLEYVKSLREGAPV